MMQKKQYEAIAAALREEHERARSAEMAHGIQWAAKVIATVLGEVSGDPTFDRARFLKACGVEE